MSEKYKTPKIEELLTSGVHFGHQLRRWHPKMEPYIFAAKKNIHIIDLEKTQAKLKEACEFLYETTKNGGQIIFVGTKKQAHEIIEIEAKRSGALYVNERWLGGTLTNYKVIKEKCQKLVTLLRRKESGDLEKYTKKERLLIDREIEKLQKSVGGIVGLKGLPAALFIIDVRREKTAVREAKRSGVKLVALVDTNSDPTGIDYVIPGNDDALKAIACVIRVVADAVESGYKECARKKEEKEEVSTEVLLTAKEIAADSKPKEKIEKTEKTVIPKVSKVKEKVKEKKSKKAK